MINALTEATVSNGHQQRRMRHPHFYINENDEKLSAILEDATSAAVCTYMYRHLDHYSV